MGDRVYSHTGGEGGQFSISWQKHIVEYVDL